MSEIRSSQGALVKKMPAKDKIKACLMVGLLALAEVLHLVKVSDYVVLPLAIIALLWVALFLGYATDNFTGHAKPGVVGLVQSSIGNAPEAFSVFFLLQSGLVSLALASLIGSVVVNALLMLGVVYTIGSIKQGGKMKFNPRLGNDTVKMSALVVMVVGFIAIAEHSDFMTNQQGDQISLFAAIVIFLVYVLMLVVHAKSDEGEKTETPKNTKQTVLSLKTTIGLMLLGAIGAAVGAELVVGTLEPVMKALSLPEAFVGFVFVAIIGNASENLGAFAQASKGNNDVAVSMIKHSVAQVVAGLLPLMIVISWIVGHHLSFTMPLVYLAALALAPIAISITSSDGEAEPHEGALLIVLYVIMAASLFIAG